MAPNRIPDSFSNGWIPTTPEPSRETHANGLGKFTMRRAMYGERAGGLTTVGLGLYRRTEEKMRLIWHMPHHLRSEAYRPMDHHARAVTPSDDRLTYSSLLEGSIPDHGTQPAMMGPIKRPTSPRLPAEHSHRLSHLANNQGNPSSTNLESYGEASKWLV